MVENSFIRCSSCNMGRKRQCGDCVAVEGEVASNVVLALRLLRFDKVLRKAVRAWSSASLREVLTCLASLSTPSIASEPGMTVCMDLHA